MFQMFSRVLNIYTVYILFFKNINPIRDGTIVSFSQSGGRQPFFTKVNKVCDRYVLVLETS